MVLFASPTNIRFAPATFGLIALTVFRHGLALIGGGNGPIWRFATIIPLGPVADTRFALITTTDDMWEAVVLAPSVLFAVVHTEIAYGSWQGRRLKYLCDDLTEHTRLMCR